ncbi:hypothetical protein WN51_04698 [Melipona quadrifasciata]|uniref:Uncharacterized protein n=1 Tax=Melipona quadrifasciata TaxID=166423 RepID=A0A0M9AD56_9HYME|nr:hypothetical protein WN51_04698 [Melipona quadrifasciata]
MSYFESARTESLHQWRILRSRKVRRAVMVKYSRLLNRNEAISSFGSKSQQYQIRTYEMCKFLWKIMSHLPFFSDVAASGYHLIRTL